MNTPLPKRVQWRRATDERLVTCPKLDDRMDRHHATEFLARLLKRDFETIRAVKDKIGKKIDTAQGNGKLSAPDFLFRELVEWAKSRREMHQAVAEIYLPPRGEFRGTLTGKYKVVASGFEIPDDLALCQKVLTEVSRELMTLRAEVAFLRGEAAELDELRRKTQAARRLASDAGKRGGRPRKHV